MVPIQPICSTNEDESIPSTSDNYQFGFIGSVMQASATNNVNEINALQFDFLAELLWAGGSAGKVSSYFGVGLDSYTSFTTNLSVKAIEINNECVLTVTKESLSAFKRTGIIQLEHFSSNFEDLTCICSFPEAPNSFVVGGKQEKLVQLDITTQKEQRLTRLKNSDCLILRANDRYIFNADSNGIITMRSKGSMEPVHKVLAHVGGISDFDISGNTLITCGYTTKARSSICDPFLKVYDIRKMNPLLPFSTLFPPVLCRFANSVYNNQVIMGSKYGHVFAADLNEPQTNILYQSCNQSVPKSMSISTTKQCVAVGNSDGSILLFGDRDDLTFNAESWPPVFPTVEELFPPMPVDNVNSILSSIPTPMPPSVGYCSDFWPVDSLKKVFRQPKAISPKIIQSARRAQSVLYAKNQNANVPFGKMNICPYELNNSSFEESQYLVF